MMTHAMRIELAAAAFAAKRAAEHAHDRDDRATEDAHLRAAADHYRSAGEHNLARWIESQIGR